MANLDAEFNAKYEQNQPEPLGQVDAEVRLVLCKNSNCRDYNKIDENKCSLFCNVEECEFWDLMEPESSPYHKKYKASNNEKTA